MEQLQIRMLGEFSLSYAQNRISDTGSRSGRVWQLLAYLIWHGKRPVPARELICALWGEDPASSNPENALKITLHRARSLLDRLWPDAGHSLIRHTESGYIWNQQFPCLWDAAEFERLCRWQTDDETALLESRLAALELYRGELLGRQSSELWVIPSATHYHNLYVQTVLETASLLDLRQQHSQAVLHLRRAIALEPYHEPLHQLLIRQLAALGDQKAAREVYDGLCRRLMEDFDIKPSEETRSIFQSSMRTVTDGSMSMDALLEDVRERDPAPGAMQCDYDSFRLLCRLFARSAERTGRTTHIALISLSSPPERPMSGRSFAAAMRNMGQQIRLNLRRGDIFSQCSLSQYILMLPEANYENSCMVCRRLLAAYCRKHPSSPVRLHFMVQPLSAQLRVPSPPAQR